MHDETKRLSEPTKCGHCGNKAPMEIVGEHNNRERLLDEENRYIGYDCVTNYGMLVCPSCDGINVRRVEWGPWNEEEDPVPWQLLFPTPQRGPDGLPAAVAKAFDAAVQIKTIDVNAFAVLLGRVLEHVCNDRAAQGTSLNEKLTDLAKKGEIPQKLVEMAHGLRQLRNVGAHVNLGELTSAEIPVLDALCRAILEYVYSAPRLVASVQNHLEKLRIQTQSAK